MSLADIRARAGGSAGAESTTSSEGVSLRDTSTPAEENSAPGVWGTTTQSVGSPVGNAGDTGAEQPYGVATSVAPSGTELYYQAGPKRLYRLRAPVRLSEGMWEYGEWREVPSVSTVLDVLEKGGLSFWGQGIGVDGVLTLIHRGVLRWVDE